jgi:S1-C subfamily serine protease
MQIFARSYELELISCQPEILAEIAQSTSGSMYGTRPITQLIKGALGSLLLKFQAHFPDATHIACQRGSAGYEIVAADPADPASPETLMAETQTRYLEMKHARSFLNAEALRQTLSRVFCQDDNIHQLIERLEFWYGQENKDRPLSLFLVGVSGVGKTYTAELLAEALRPYMYDFSYLNMSEFSQEATVFNLIGSPSGHVGCEETPRLFAELERSNRLVILLDEIEKAHPKVFITLMQLLDKGHLSWNKGVGDFRECIILLTSNLQRDALVRLKSGFNQRKQSIQSPEFQDAVKAILIQAGIAPELCGRINRFLVYNPLTPEATVRIVFQEIQKLCLKQGFNVSWVSPDLMAEIARTTAGSTSGSRAVRDQVENRLGRPMLGFKRQYTGEKALRFESTPTGIQAVPASGDIDLHVQEDMILQAIAMMNDSSTPSGITPMTSAASVPALRLSSSALPATAPPSWIQADGAPFLGADQIQHLISTMGFIEVTLPDGSTGTGSGCVITPDGKLLTSFHVIENAASVRVRLGHGSDIWFDGTTISGDPDSDLAILQLEGSQFPFAPLAPSGQALSIGDAVSLLGYPLGEMLDGNVTYTAGVISSLRQIDQVRMIQIDASASPGNSGGPLVRQKDGRIIGVLKGGIDRKRAANINMAVHIQEFHDRLISSEEPISGSRKSPSWKPERSVETMGEKSSEVIDHE